jgi:hypothetical protein
MQLLYPIQVFLSYGIDPSFLRARMAQEWLVHSGLFLPSLHPKIIRSTIYSISSSVKTPPPPSNTLPSRMSPIHLQISSSLYATLAQVHPRSP